MHHIKQNERRVGGSNINEINIRGQMASFLGLFLCSGPRPRSVQLLTPGRSIKESSLWNSTKEKDLKLMIEEVS